MSRLSPFSSRSEEDIEESSNPIESDDEDDRQDEEDEEDQEAEEELEAEESPPESPVSPIVRALATRPQQPVTVLPRNGNGGITIPRLVQPRVLTPAQTPVRTPARSTPISSVPSTPGVTTPLSPIIPEVLSPVPSPIATMETAFCGLNSIGQGNFPNSLRVADINTGTQSQLLVYPNSVYNIVIPASIRATGILGLASTNIYLASLCGVYGGRIPNTVVPLSTYRTNIKLEDPCLLLYSISSGLEALHNLNIVHGSLSDQVIGVESGAISRMQIVDFTSATSLLGRTLAIPINLVTYDTNDTSFAISGSSNYLAPEWPSIGTYTDIWSLGILILQMFGISPDIPKGTYTSQRAAKVLKEFYLAVDIWYDKILNYFVGHYIRRAKSNVDLIVSNLLSDQPIDLSGITSEDNMETLRASLSDLERNSINIRRRINEELTTYAQSLYGQISGSIVRLLSGMLSSNPTTRVTASYVRRVSFDIITALGINIEPIEPTVIQTTSITGPIYNSWYYLYMYQILTLLAKEFRVNWATLFAAYHYSYHMLASIKAYTYPDGNIVSEADMSQRPDIFESAKAEISELVSNAIYTAMFMYDKVSAIAYAYNADRIDNVMRLLDGKLIVTRIFPIARSANVLAEVWRSLTNSSLYYGVDWTNVLSTNEAMDAESKSTVAIV